MGEYKIKLQSGTNTHLPRGLTIVSLLVIVLWGVVTARPFLIPLSISSLLSLMMAPLVRLMKKYHLPEWSAIFTSAILLILPFFSLIYVLVWQGQALAKDFPNIIAAMNRVLATLIHSALWQRLHLPEKLDVSFFIQSIAGQALEGIQIAISGLGAVLGAGSQLALVLLFAVMMLASRDQLKKCTEKILKQNSSINRSDILDQVITLIERFLIARLLILILVAWIDTVLLWLFHIRYSVLLGSFLGIMTLVPAIGFIIGIIPSIVMALATGQPLLNIVFLIICLIIVSFIESNILTPKMVGKRLNINALMTFVGLFAGGLLWGIWGMFLSIPVLGTLRIIFSTVPSLQPWGELLAERDETNISHLKP